MFDAERFVADCQVALAESGSMLAVKEVLDRTLTGPDLTAGWGEDPGVTVVHHGPTLTVATVVIPAGAPASLPHDHRMWALVGIAGGQEDNSFFRRAGAGLEARGGRSVRAGESLAMGDDTVHAIHNPLTHGALAAIHVYGGDLVTTPRSMWTEPDHAEQPYDDQQVLRGGGFRLPD